MKRNLIRLTVSLMTVAFSAAGAFAQTPGGATEVSWSSKGLGYLGAVIGFGIAAGLCGIGQGRVAAAACEGIARNPGAAGGVRAAMILGLVFVETLTLFTFALGFLLYRLL